MTPLAATQVPLRTSPAMADALHRIRRDFGPGADVRAVKEKCRQVLRFPLKQDWHKRYGARAAHICEAIICWRAENEPSIATGRTRWRPPPSLHIAINIIERQYRTENHALHIARALGRGNGLSVMVLRELRLLLRFMRAHGMACEFPKVLGEFAR